LRRIKEVEPALSSGELNPGEGENCQGDREENG